MKRGTSLLVSLGIALVAFATPACGGSSADAVDTATTAADLSTATGGWEQIGESRVDGSLDRDVIVIDRDDSRFDSVQIRVEGSSLLMFEVKIVFGDGETFEPNVRLVFDENTRSRVIDLPGARRFIRQVDFAYANLPGGGSASVQLWAAQ